MEAGDSGPIVCFGNSLTEGYRVPPEESYPAVLETLTGRPTVNLGVSGDTTGDGVRRLGLVTARRPSVTLVEFGINDWFMEYPLEVAEQNLETIVTTLKSAGSAVVLIGFSLPGRGTEPWERMYADLAARAGLSLIPDVFSGLTWGREMFLEDGTHPNGRGYRRIAENCCAHLEANGL
jgi:acyl-CoA thioesterase-1